MLVLLLVVAATSVRAGAAHRCYVCVPRDGPTVAEVSQLFPDHPPPHCDDFAASDATSFVRECPSGHEGCLTQTNGTLVTHTCAERAMRDCKMANQIHYCYCPGQECNAPRRGGPPDDEDQDSLEGSGGGGTSGSTLAPAPHPPATTTARTTAAPSSAAPHLTSPSALVATTLLAWIASIRF